MKRILLVCLVLTFSPPLVHAQRNAPVWESHLASISICHKENGQLSIDLLFKKCLGPPEHTEHQMYLIAYLKKDEGTILKLASDTSLLDKTKRDKKMLLEVLKDRCLIAILDSKVAKRTDTHTFPFHFSFRSSDLFARIKTLKDFDPANKSGNPKSGEIRTGWPRAVARPGLPQTRTCAINAFGSSSYPFATLRHVEWIERR